MSTTPHNPALASGALPPPKPPAHISGAPPPPRTNNASVILPRQPWPAQSSGAPPRPTPTRSLHSSPAPIGARSHGSTAPLRICSSIRSPTPTNTGQLTPQEHRLRLGSTASASTHPCPLMPQKPRPQPTHFLVAPPSAPSRLRGPPAHSSVAPSPHHTRLRSPAAWPPDTSGGPPRQTKAAPTSGALPLPWPTLASGALPLKTPAR